MKRWYWILALALVLGACSKEEQAAPAADEQPMVEQPAAEEMPADESAATADEVLEVVEESAAEPEPAEREIVLAQADVPVAPAEWKYREGENFTRLVPTQPTVGGADKIEVGEFFWYGCPHCYDMEPYINGWAEKAPSNVRFVRIPATWNALLVLHARLYYTEEILVRNGTIKDGPAFHEAVFMEYHQRGNRLTSEDAIQKFFARFGVSEQDFESTWNSFEVDQKLRVAEDLMRRYSISSVPTIVVNGKYRTSAAEAGSYPKLLELLDELVLRESLR